MDNKESEIKRLAKIINSQIQFHQITIRKKVKKINKMNIQNSMGDLVFRASHYQPRNCIEISVFSNGMVLGFIKLSQSKNAYNFHPSSKTFDIVTLKNIYSFMIDMNLNCLDFNNEKRTEILVHFQHLPTINKIRIAESKKDNKERIKAEKIKQKGIKKLQKVTQKFQTIPAKKDDFKPINRTEKQIAYIDSLSIGYKKYLEGLNTKK